MGHNKIIMLIIFLNPFLIILGQLKNGEYKSKNGSILILNKDNTYFFQKERSIILDVKIKEIILISSGVYSQKDNLLFLSSSKSNKYIDSIKTRGFILKENKISGNKDSIKIVINDKSKLLKTYICNTGLDYLNPSNDISGCLKLNNLNKLPIFFSDKYFFRVYPNFEDSRVRDVYYFNTIFFDSNVFSKKDRSDLFLDIDVDILDFSYSNFEQDIVLVKEGVLYFKGEEFTLKNS